MSSLFDALGVSLRYPANGAPRDSWRRYYLSNSKTFRHASEAYFD